MNAQLFKLAMCLMFGVYLHLHAYFVCKSSEGSGKTTGMHNCSSLLFSTFMTSSIIIILEVVRYELCMQIFKVVVNSYNL